MVPKEFNGLFLQDRNYLPVAVTKIITGFVPLVRVKPYALEHREIFRIRLSVEEN